MLTREMADEYLLRLQKIRREMERSSLTAILVADNANLFYVAGMVFRGYVYIPLSAELSPLFFVIRPMSVEGEGVVQIRKPEDIPAILDERGYGIAESVGLEYDALPYNEVKRLQKVFAESSSANSSQAMRNARMEKTEYEIGQMREDGLHQIAVYRNIDRLYKEDMTDLELQIEIERALRREGCLGYLRVAGRLMEINLGSVIAGGNADNPTPYDFAMGGRGVSPSLPVGADGRIIKPGTTVMVDVNGNFNGYQTDMTRTYVVGEVSDLAHRCHDCSIEILRRLEKEALPGVEAEQLYHIALEIVKEHGLEAYFMGHKQQAKFIGHGVGIQLNEQPPIAPRCKIKLKENMTITLEPKFVVPEVGAVGVENTYCVRAEGLENLTPLKEELISL